MARWKARAEFLLSVIELLLLSLMVEALQGKTCQNSLPSEVGRSLGAKISGEWVVPKPQAHDVLYCRLIRTEPRRRATRTENFVMFGRVVFEICERTDRQTDIQADTKIAILRTRLDGEVVRVYR